MQPEPIPRRELTLGFSAGECDLGPLISAVRRTIVLAVAVVCMVSVAYSAPIQRVQGTILEVGEGFLILKPDDGSKSLKLLLRWKAHFVPPKLPLKGDHVLILYKAKEEGPVIYEVSYLKQAPVPELPSLQEKPDSNPN